MAILVRLFRYRIQRDKQSQSCHDVYAEYLKYGNIWNSDFLVSGIQMADH